MKPLLLSFPWDGDAPQRLASELDLEHRPFALHRYPDGEILVTGPGSASRTVILYCSLFEPNEKLIALMLAADTLRRAGAARIVLVAPYMSYMRQDIAFEAGQAVSQQAVGKFLSALFDRILTVDAHLHRTPEISDVFPGAEAENLIAAELIADYAAVNGFDRDTLVVGPDRESRQWVTRVADRLGGSVLVGEKTRFSDRQVEIEFPVDDLSGRKVLLVDDIVSSGGTIIKAAQKLISKGAWHITLAVTHALFEQDIGDALSKAGVDQIWATDSVRHEASCIALAPLLVTSLRSECE